MRRLHVAPEMFQDHRLESRATDVPSFMTNNEQLFQAFLLRLPGLTVLLRARLVLLKAWFRWMLKAERTVSITAVKTGC